LHSKEYITMVQIPLFYHWRGRVSQLTLSKSSQFRS
jgi:hypothetical protein